MNRVSTSQYQGTLNLISLRVDDLVFAGTIDAVDNNARGIPDEELGQDSSYIMMWGVVRWGDKRLLDEPGAQCDRPMYEVLTAWGSQSADVDVRDDTS